VSDLSEFLSRMSEAKAREDKIAAWHLKAYAEGGIPLPYRHTETWISVNVWDYNEENEYALDVEKTLDALAVVTKFAAKTSGAAKTYTSSDFELEIELDGCTTVRYVADREAVCTKKVVGYEDVPEKIVPASRKEIVEWECDPVSLLGRETEVAA
jgi:hypothetical protein